MTSWFKANHQYHPDSKPITIRLLQPQSHVAPLRNIILIQSQSPLDSLNQKYHPHSCPYSPLQPQSHVAPLRNIILIQSQSPLDSYSLNHMSPPLRNIILNHMPITTIHWFKANHLLQPQSHIAPPRNIILIQRQSPLDSYSLNHIARILILRNYSYTQIITKKCHPHSKPITIRLLQPQSHVAPLRNIILIQSQSPLDSYSLNHVSLH